MTTMRIASLIAATTATAALLVGPGLAAGDPPVGSPSGDHAAAGNHPAAPAATGAGAQQTPTTPGPSASASAKANAYGKHCQRESKKHVAGQKGTPFSQCVTALAKLASGQTDSPKVACRTLSKKHVAGQKGTPFSQCVSAAAKLKSDQQAGADSKT
jgi:hypothetical protein